MIGQHLDFVDAEIPAPTFLRKRQIHTDGINLHAGQLGCFFVETLGLRIANRRVERRHYAEDPDVVAGSRQIHGLQPVVHRVEIGRLVAGLQFRPQQRQRIASHRRSSRSFHAFSSSMFDRISTYCSNSSNFEISFTGN